MTSQPKSVKPGNQSIQTVKAAHETTLKSEASWFQIIHAEIIGINECMQKNIMFTKSVPQP